MNYDEVPWTSRHGAYHMALIRSRDLDRGLGLGRGLLSKLRKCFQVPASIAVTICAVVCKPIVIIYTGIRNLLQNETKKELGSWC